MNTEAYKLDEELEFFLNTLQCQPNVLAVVTSKILSPWEQCLPSACSKKCVSFYIMHHSQATSLFFPLLRFVFR